MKPPRRPSYNASPTPRPKHETRRRDASSYFLRIASYKLMSAAIPAPVIMPA